jgi:hypothetical protein
MTTQGVIVRVEGGINVTDHAGLPLTGTAVKPPGTYNVGVRCQIISGGAEVRGNLTVIAVAT